MSEYSPHCLDQTATVEFSPVFPVYDQEEADLLSLLMLLL